MNIYTDFSRLLQVLWPWVGYLAMRLTVSSPVTFCHHHGSSCGSNTHHTRAVRRVCVCVCVCAWSLPGVPGSHMTMINSSEQRLLHTVT